MKLFSDMTPAEKLEHCKRCISNGYEHLQAEHGPVELADILDVWDYWTPYLLERLERLEAVLASVEAFLASFPKHYHGFPGKLEWWEIHALRQSCEAIRAADEGANGT